MHVLMFSAMMTVMKLLRVESGRTKELQRKTKHTDKSRAEGASWRSRGAAQCSRQTRRTLDHAVDTWDVAGRRTHALEILTRSTAAAAAATAPATIACRCSPDGDVKCRQLENGCWFQSARANWGRSGEARRRHNRPAPPYSLPAAGDSFSGGKHFSCALQRCGWAWQLGQPRRSSCGPLPLPRKSGIRWVC